MSGGARRGGDLRDAESHPAGVDDELANAAPPEFLHEHVRGGGEEHAQLIGPEATAARASDLESVVEFLDPIFDVAASAVHLFVNEPRRWPKRRDDESG